MEKKDKERLSVKSSNDPPRFAHICKTVRIRDEFMTGWVSESEVFILRGFFQDCDEVSLRQR